MSGKQSAWPSVSANIMWGLLVLSLVFTNCGSNLPW